MKVTEKSEREAPLSFIASDSLHALNLSWLVSRHLTWVHIEFPENPVRTWQLQAFTEDAAILRNSWMSSWSNIKWGLQVYCIDVLTGCV